MPLLRPASNTNHDYLPHATFQHLSAELRTRIWELTVEPRIVEVSVIFHRPNRLLPPTRLLCSSTATPAVLQTCREAREYLSRHPDNGYRYEKAFSEIATTPYAGFASVAEDDPERERYVWLNFDNDMISVGKTDLHNFLAVAYQFRRLRLERVVSCEYFSHTESMLFFRTFRNLVEIHLVCLDGIRAGEGIAEDLDSSCALENIYFLDTEAQGGMMLNTFDLEAWVFEGYEDELEERRRLRNDI
ncbi:hypothetical protein BKA61DRAFT_707064 [Leptodontidium sp. MPI-SDFR-AT-0119]|nr:hypothetical protein BKA61DRAFT_707064 [Leptodontidium sp. MPI-SDFR-AT-0119]